MKKKQDLHAKNIVDGALLLSQFAYPLTQLCLKHVIRIRIRMCKDFQRNQHESHQNSEVWPLAGVLERLKQRNESFRSVYKLQCVPLGPDFGRRFWLVWQKRNLSLKVQWIFVGTDCTQWHGGSWSYIFSTAPLCSNLTTILYSHFICSTLIQILAYFLNNCWQAQSAVTMNSKYSGIPRLAEKYHLVYRIRARSLSPSVYGQRKSYVKLRSIVMGIHHVTPIYSNICKLNQPIETRNRMWSTVLFFVFKGSGWVKAKVGPGWASVGICRHQIYGELVHRNGSGWSQSLLSRFPPVVWVELHMYCAWSTGFVNCDPFTSQYGTTHIGIFKESLLSV